MEIKIGDIELSNNGKPIFIADIAANHDGDINRAFKLIELAKEAGADVAKFQNFKADKIVCKEAFDAMPKQTHQAGWKKSVYDVYNEASLDYEWTYKLKEKCDEVGIEYMTSPYDFTSVDHVDPFVNAYKIGSGDITWHEILEYIAKKNKPILLATGAATMNEVQEAMNTIEKTNDKIVLMQCNTNYTASKENFKNINLNVLRTYKEKFPQVILGLSDHTYGHATVVGAIALGARVIEKHFTDDNNRVGPDHKFAMNPITWRDMVDRSMEVWYALGDGIKRIEKNEIDSRVVQQRGLYFSNTMKCGDIIRKEDIVVLRPILEDGIEASKIKDVVGKRIKKDMEEKEQIRWEDIEIA